MAQWTTRLFSKREVPGSNLTPDKILFIWLFSLFSYALQPDNANTNEINRDIT